VRLDERFRWWMIGCAVLMGAVVGHVLAGPLWLLGPAAGLVGAVVGIVLGLAWERWCEIARGEVGDHG
jgi:hypothetical protein